MDTGFEKEVLKTYRMMFYKEQAPIYLKKKKLTEFNLDNCAVIFQTVQSGSQDGQSLFNV